MRLEQLEPKATSLVNTAVAESSPASDWPEPDLSALRLNRRPPPKLPLDVLGDHWAQWVQDAARAAVAPIDYVVAPLLAAASALIGHARWAQAWKGWKEPPHLWCAAVGDSGDGKSPGADTVYEYIISSIESRMAANFPDQLWEAQAAIEAAKVRLESWKDELRTAIKEGRSVPPQPGPVPQEPMAPRLMLSDVTIERVASLLASAAPKGVLMTRDELVASRHEGLQRRCAGLLDRSLRRAAVLC
jgi:hypothetical protein